MRPKIILKFGGTSLATPEALRQMTAIALSRMNEQPVVVVSALGASPPHEKVTDLLEKLGRSVIQGKTDLSLLQDVRERHDSTLQALGLPPSVLSVSLEHLEKLLRAIEAGTVPVSSTAASSDLPAEESVTAQGGTPSRRRAVSASRESSPEQGMVTRKDPSFETAALDLLMGMGEILSAEIVAALLRKEGLPFQAITPELLSFRTDRVFQNATLLEASLEEIARVVISSKEHLVVPGYIGVSEDGLRTTLGRGGSDYTAAVLGAALKRDVEIWTDVDGIFRANPAYLPPVMKKDGHPATIPSLSHDEAFQMAAFGSRVLYEKTLHAVKIAARKGKHLKITIKNTFNPDHPGTTITSLSQDEGKPKGITCLEGTQLLTFYPESEEEAAEISREVLKLTGGAGSASERASEVPGSGGVSRASGSGAVTKISSLTSGRVSFVFDRYVPELSSLESRFSGHLSRDQILLKIVGDGLGENHEMLARIHHSLDVVENPEKHGMTLVHKTPHLLTDNTFEVVVKKRGIQEVVLRLYKDLFMESVIQVGLLGLGTVGTGVLRYHQELYSEEKTGFQLRFPVIVVRDPEKPRPMALPGTLTTSFEEALHDPRIDVILEVMGGIEPAREVILEALKEGKHVVTANKALLATHGREIFAAAARYRRNIGFEASVCGEVPVIDDFLKIPSQEDILALEGIVNGTSNYILTRVAEGMEFSAALKGAQEKGFAEADPSFDLQGQDAAQKLALLGSILFNAFFDWRSIPRESIEAITHLDARVAREWGYAIKPLARARRVSRGEGLQDRFFLHVGPALVPTAHTLYPIRDETNAIALFLRGRTDPVTKVGKGAGAIPTARSIMKDVLDVAKKSRARMVDLPRFYLRDGTNQILPLEEASSPFYLRFSVEDLPGVFGKITTTLGEHGLSIRMALQQETTSPSPPSIVLMIKEASQGKVKSALSACSSFPFVHTAVAIPVLKTLTIKEDL